jgi:hypothetical protein
MDGSRSFGVPTQIWQWGVGSLGLLVSSDSLWPLSLCALTGKLLLDWYLMKDLYPL